MPHVLMLTAIDDYYPLLYLGLQHYILIPSLHFHLATGGILLQRETCPHQLCGNLETG